MHFGIQYSLIIYFRKHSCVWFVEEEREREKDLKSRIIRTKNYHRTLERSRDVGRMDGNTNNHFHMGMLTGMGMGGGGGGMIGMLGSGGGDQGGGGNAGAGGGKKAVHVKVSYVVAVVRTNKRRGGAVMQRERERER